MGLLSALGATVRRTMGEVREEIIRTAKGGKKEEKARISDKLDYMVFEALTEQDTFSILAMGRTETLGCYCPVNSLLRGAIETLSESFDTILIDGQAGARAGRHGSLRREHLRLRPGRKADHGASGRFTQSCRGSRRREGSHSPLGRISPRFALGLQRRVPDRAAAPTVA